jgi:hypothetical protein
MCANVTNGTSCGGGLVCMGGVCAKKGPGAACAAGTECASGSCVNGACCGNACAAGPCRTCTAATQWLCSNLPNETKCGLGGAQVCRNGACVAPCPPGQIQCDGACVNPANNPLHCGGCRIKCPGGVCLNGSCGGGPDDCPGFLIRCNGVCVNPRSDDLNCGSCGHVCMAPTRDCRLGICVIGRPMPGPGPGPQPLPQ